MSEKQRGTCDNDSHEHEFISPVPGMDGSGCKNWKPMSEKREQSAPLPVLQAILNWCDGNQSATESLAHIEELVIAELRKPVADPAPAAPRPQHLADLDKVCEELVEAESAMEAQCSIEQSEKGKRCPKCGRGKGDRRHTRMDDICEHSFHAASVPATAERCPEYLRPRFDSYWAKSPFSKSRHAGSYKDVAWDAVRTLIGDGRPEAERTLPSEEWSTVENTPKQNGPIWFFVRGVGIKTGYYDGAHKESWWNLDWVRDRGVSLERYADKDVACWHPRPYPNWPIARPSQGVRDSERQYEALYASEFEVGGGLGLPGEEREESPWTDIAAKIWAGDHSYPPKAIEQALDLFFTAHCECSHKGISTTRENLAGMMAALLEQKGKRG